MHNSLEKSFSLLFKDTSVDTIVVNIPRRFLEDKSQQGKEKKIDFLEIFPNDLVFTKVIKRERNQLIATETVSFVGFVYLNFHHCKIYYKCNTL